MSLLDSAMYSVTFDAASMARIAAMMNAQPTFARYYAVAMSECVNLVNMKAQKNAPVGVYADPRHQGGNLRRSIRGQIVTPWLGRVGVLSNVPYARRREFGFDGRTDSLGRFYPLDPKDSAKRSHMFYLRRALEDSRPFIATRFRAATQMAIRTLAVGE